MTAPWSLILRVFAFAAFVIEIFLVLAKVNAPELAAVLLPVGLALWVLATIVGPERP